MIITGIKSANPFPLFNDVYIDADNPIADAASVPGFGPLSSVIDLGVYRNEFTQAAGGYQPYLTPNGINGNNFISFDDAIQSMSCPYAVPDNDYAGAMTITIAWLTNDISPGGNYYYMFARQGTGGFAVGQLDDGYIFTTIGSGNATLSGQFTAGVWQVASFRFDNVSNVDFFKNGVQVGNAAASPITPTVQSMILGAIDNVPNLSWSGRLMCLGWAFRLLTDTQIILLHKYAMGRMGI